MVCRGRQPQVVKKKGADEVALQKKCDQVTDAPRSKVAAFTYTDRK